MGNKELKGLGMRNSENYAGSGIKSHGAAYDLNTCQPVSPKYQKEPSVFNRSTNVSACFEQKGGSCYAHAATSAYINTCSRIYGATIPLYNDCLKIADYSNGEGGSPKKAIELLELKYNKGIQCENHLYGKIPKIETVMKLSVIVCFTTSQAGWDEITEGKLLSKPSGPTDGWHATLVEGYDMDRNDAICKNSWGDAGTTMPRFHLRFSALHDFYITKVFFLIANLPKSLPAFKSVIRGPFEKANGLNFFLYKKADGSKFFLMDANTAKYESSLVCERKSLKYSDFKTYDADIDALDYIGFPINEWIEENFNDTFGFFERLKSSSFLFSGKRYCE